MCQRYLLFYEVGVRGFFDGLLIHTVGLGEPTSGVNFFSIGLNYLYSLVDDIRLLVLASGAGPCIVVVSPAIF